MRVASDVAVLGSGFAGSLAALVARRLGRSVAVIERGAHPRFAIGESSSPLANLLLETLAERYGLERVRPLAKWGSWRQAYPEIACGLKRGFTFYAHRPGQPFTAAVEREEQLLVAASPRDEIADTHWYRPDFDHFLALEAERAGALSFYRTRLERVAPAGNGFRLEGEREGERLEFSARLVVDATGPRGFLNRALALGETTFPSFGPTEALYTHFQNVRRLEDLAAFSAPEPTPYPIDDAAVHHVFPGGWIWVLRFNNAIVSAGVAATKTLARELRLEEGAPAWERLLERLPGVRAQFREAHTLLPFVHRPRLSFRSRRAAGPGWTLLPSAAAFVDPLLSTGFPLALLGIERLGRALEEDWGTPRLAARLERDARRTLSEADTAALLVAALYRCFCDFPLFAGLSKLYFAAASYSEAARRLGRPELSGSFLCADRPGFGAAFRRCCREALGASPAKRRDPAWRQTLLEAITRAIEPIDVIGISDRDRRGWYPVEAHDLLRSAYKLGATAREIERLLERTGFSPAERRSAGAGR